MFKLTTIGSCRIATPGRLFRNDYGFELNLKRNYGYCHTSSEALQQIRFMQDEIALPQDIWRLVARGADYNEMVSQTHEGSHLYIVELSSAKRLMHKDTCVQLNYLGNEFREFFSDRAQLSKFWSACKSDNQDQIDTFLKDHWSATPDQIAESDILRHLRMTLTTEDQLRADIREIMARLPNVMFVTHVNAVKKDGLPIDSRAAFIDTVTRSVRAEGGLVYNPTARMEEFGQNAAIEDHSDSLSHFTEDFFRFLFPDWLELALAPAIDKTVSEGGEAAVEAILEPHVTAMIASGRADRRLATRLETLRQTIGDVPQLLLLQSKLDVVCASADKALDRLAKTFKNNPTDAAIGIELLMLAFLQDQITLAEDTLQKLTTQGVSVDASLLFDASRNLTHKNRRQEALGFLEVARKLAGRQITQNQASLYVQTVSEVDKTLLAALSDQALHHLLTVLPPKETIFLLACARPDEVLPRCGRDAGALEGDELLPLLSELERHSMSDLALTVFAMWRANRPDERLMHIGLRQFIDTQFQASQQADLDLPEELSRLTRILKAHPTHSEARVKVRDLRRSMRNDIRALYAAKDLPALARFEEAQTFLSDPLWDLPLLQARLAFEQEDFEACCHYAQKAVELDPEHFMSWVLMMRSGLKSNNILATYTAAVQVRDLATEETERLKAEAESRLARVPVLAFKAARNTDDPFEAKRLYDLAQLSSEISDKAEERTRRLAAQVARTVREMEVEAAPEDFAAFSRQAVETFPDNERIRLSTARHYMRQGEYDAALTHWNKAVALDPSNDMYRMQRDRCSDRISLANKEQ